MALSEICRICLSVNVRMFVLKETGLQNLYKTLMKRFMDEDEEPIIVCFICHAKLDRCRRLQQQAIESNAVLEQLLAGGSMSITKPLKARDEIQFTPIYLIDIRPVECYIENDCNDKIYSLDSIKVEEENFDNDNFKFEENGNHESEQYITPTNNSSEQSEKNIKSNTIESNINDVRKENLNFESSTVKSNPKVKKDNQPISKKGKHPAKVMKKKILKQKSVNILTEKTSDASTEYNFVCDDYSKNISTKDIFAKHISYTLKTQKNLDTLTEIFNCNICKFKTSQKRYILAHLKAHVAKQVHCCNNCDYKCTRKGDLQKHMKIHTGEKPFSCRICDYRCITKSSLQTHNKIHKGEKNFLCNICGYKFIQKNNLRRHITIHTGEKPFSCHICEFKCKQKSQLKDHIKIHTGEKPYSCNVCVYKCIQKSSLQRHMKIHIGEKPFS